MSSAVTVGAEDERLMRQALSWARRGLEAGELPIGAVVAAGGEVLAGAHTNERAEGRLLVHAELDALLAADATAVDVGDRGALTLYTTVEPCLMCLGAAMSMFVPRVVFSLEAEGDGSTSLIAQWRRDEVQFPGYQPPAVSSGVLRDESLALFEEYLAADPPDDGPTRWARRLLG